MTIAFSTKSNRWTTRYSFEPQHYFTVDQQLVSFSPRELNSANEQVDNGIAWRHDATETNNSFYGSDYNSSFSVISNQNPSATKKFEAMSLEESNYEFWTVDVQSSSGASVAFGNVPNSPSSFVKKHNDLYAEIPRSQALRDGRLVLVGTIDPSELTFDKINSGVLKMKTIEPISNKGIFVYPRFVPAHNKPSVILTSGISSPIVSLSSRSGSDDQIYVKIKSIDIKSKTISLETNGAPFDTADQNLFTDPPGTIPIFSLDNRSGEAMDGDWLKITVETAGVNPSFELYAVNVDQHVVNLDHSLGQNN